MPEPASFDLILHGRKPDYSVQCRGSSGETSYSIPVTYPENVINEFSPFLEHLIAEEEDLRKLGSVLFNFLFPPAVAARFRELKGQQGEGGFLLRLLLPQNDPDLHGIPWEVVFDPEQEDFLALTARTPLIRYVPTTNPLQRIDVPEQLRVLLVTASPPSLRPLDVGAEAERLEQVLRPYKKEVRLQIVPDPTREEFRTAIDNFDPHVLQFAGHGGIEQGQGGLYLLGNKKADFVPADKLARLLKESSVQIAVINACHSAAAVVKHVEREPHLQAVAFQLAAAGLPAVVGMQYTLPDRAAIKLTEALYAAIVRGEPLGAALTAARRALDFDLKDGCHWVNPVLFTRDAEGRIFKAESRRKREVELAYLDALQYQEELPVQIDDLYVEMSGEAHVRRRSETLRRHQPVVANPAFRHLQKRLEADLPVQERHFEEVIPELLENIPQAVLLGEPGAGKTTTLLKLAAVLSRRAREDFQAPIPLLVRLQFWTAASQPLESFLAERLGEVAGILDDLLAENRAALLLDGLNEIPPAQRHTKYPEIQRYLARSPKVMVVVSCREHDYTDTGFDLGLDRVIIDPLDPIRVHDFAHRNFGESGEGGKFFWRLAGEEAKLYFDSFGEEFQAKIPDWATSLRVFWLEDVLPDGLEWGWQNYRWERWIQLRKRPNNILHLAANPFMLTMLVQGYSFNQGELPANRGALFDLFVESLLIREWRLGLAVGEEGPLTAQGKKLRAALTDLAYDMQALRAAEGTETNPQTVVSRPRALDSLSEDQLYQAVSTNILTANEDVRFAYRLLQEYFVARAMQQRIFPEDGSEAALRAEAIWKADSWWRPTNWEEAAILLAGLYSDDCSPVMVWLAEANPELAARCKVENQAFARDDTLVDLRARWIPRLTDLKRDPNPQARAAVGRALGRLAFDDGTPLDNREGVSWHRRGDLKIPDITWGEEVPAGLYEIGGDDGASRSLEKQTVPIKHPYRLARFPVTFSQFQCFLDAQNWDDAQWWDGMPPQGEAYGAVYQLREWSQQRYPYSNHPREMVSWYQTIAFCRWLSDRLGFDVDLPTEVEWEIAARFNDGRFYPWGPDFDAARANTMEGDSIGQTSAVGIYPTGVQPKLNLFDLSGNVWEWCRNKFDDLDALAVDDSPAPRAVRGGSFLFGVSLTRAAYRDNCNPADRLGGLGFRLVRRRPPSR